VGKSVASSLPLRVHGSIADARSFFAHLQGSCSGIQGSVTEKSGSFGACRGQDAAHAHGKSQKRKIYRALLRVNRALLKV